MFFFGLGKTFDRISQSKLFEALERMGIPEKLLIAIASLYKNPTFAVKANGDMSGWKQQKSGIRQGCPLSPYLFLIVMTAMFHDIHQDTTLEQELKDNEILGTIFNEVLYADDTIIYSRNAKTLETATQDRRGRRKIRAKTKP